MTDQERYEHEKLVGDKLDKALYDMHDLDQQIQYLCTEYSKVYYAYYQNVESTADARERLKIEVDALRERITNMTMYKFGWSFAEEGDGWVDFYNY